MTSVTRDTDDTDSVNLVLNANPKAGDSVTVSYTVPGSNPLEDGAGNDVASFTDQTVTNNNSAPGKPTVTVAAKDASLEVTVAFTAHGTHNITKYQYQVKTTGSFGAWTDSTENVSNTGGTFMIGSLTNGTAHTIKVRGVSAAGDGAESDEASGTPDAPPSVSSIAFNSAGTDGAFKTGDAVTATVTFSASVTVDTTDGTPQLTIKMGGTDKVLDYSSGSPGAALVFSGYTVAANDEDTDGLSIEANKLSANGGTIKKTADTSVNAVLTHTAVAASANHKVDGVKPTLSSANASGDFSKVVLTFSEAIGAVDNTKITVKKGGTDQTTTGAAIDSTDSTKVEITLMTAFLTTDTNITVELDADAVTDVPGNGIAAVSSMAVTLVDNTAPTLSSAGTYAIDGTGTGIALQFNETIASTSIPATSAFAAKIAGTAVGVTSVTRDTDDTDSVNLVLNANPKAGDSVTVSYTVPGSNPLEDGAGNDVASFTDQTVTNNNSAPGKPTVTVAAKDASLEVTVAFTAHGTHNITKYQYQVKTTGSFGAWTDSTENVSNTGGTFMIGSLTNGTAHTIKVRGVSAAGDGAESDEASGTPDAPPSVSSIAFNSAGTDGAFKTGDAVTATVTFSASVTVDTTDGTPQLTIKMGGTDKVLDYSSGSPGAALVFSGYTVAANDEDTDGLSIEANKLSANGGTIKKTADTSVNAVLTHTAVAASANHKVDGVKPTLSSAGTYAIDGTGTGIALQFNETIASTSIPATSAFAAKIAGTAVGVTSVTRDTDDTDSVNLVLNANPKAGDSVTVSYTVPGSNPLEDGAGNDVASFTDQTVTNNNSAPGKPTVTVAAKDASLEVTVAFTAHGTHNITKYQYQVKTTGSFGAWTDSTENVSNTGGTFTIGSLTNGTAHTIKVRGVSAAGDGAESDEASGTPDAPPSVSSIAFNSAGTDGAFKTGDAVTATVTFSASVTVDTTDGTPQLTIKMGGTDKVLDYSSGSPGAALVFSGYTVAANDEDTDGLSIEANKLSANGGTIKKTADTSVNAVLTHTAVAASANHKVDGVKPTLSSANASGDFSKVVLTFSEAIGAVDNTKITVKKGGTDQTTTGAAIDSTDSTKVEITLMTAFLTTDTNITVELDADAVTDVPGNGIAAVSSMAVTLVDNTAPTLSSAGTYAIDGTGTGIALQFNETITSTSIPATSAFAAKIAGTAVGVTSVTRDTDDTDSVNLVLNANPKAGDSVTVSYTVPGSNPLEDGAGNDVASFTDQTVTNNNSAPGKPTVTVAAKDASLEVTVAFTAHGTHNITKYQYQVKTTGSFGAWTDSTENVSNTGGTFMIGSLTNGTAHTIKVRGVSAAGDGAESDEASGTPDAPPAITSVAITSAPGADKTYAISDTVTATVTFDAAVDITGSPELELDFDGTAKAAACATATNTTTMACEYEVAVGDEAAGGIAIEANKLTGGTIRATGSTTADADLDHVAVAIDADHKVDGIRPTLVTTGADAPTTSTDGETVLLVFSEDIGAVSHGDVTIQANSVTLSTTMASVAGTKVELTLTTALTAAATNLTVALAADAVDDAVGNGNLALAATGVTNAVVSATGPTVTGIALTSSIQSSFGFYRRNEDVEATVTFSEAVDITGTPQLELDFDGTAKAAACATGTNTTTMACSYRVAGGDSAPDGIAIKADKLTGGTITANGSTTAAVLDHGPVAIDADHKVDAIRPTLVTTGSDAPTTSTDGTKVILMFSEAIRSVNRASVTIQANGATLSTTAADRTGNKAEITLATALTAAATNLTVSLASNAVFDIAGNGILSVAATAITNAVDAPDPAEPPGSLKARRGDGEVHLEWAPAAAVPGDPDLAHQLRYGADGGELSQWRDIPRSAPGGPNARSYTVTGLDNGTRYAFELRVRRGGGGFGTAAEIRQTPEAPRWSVSTNRRSVHEGEDVTLSIATSNAVGFYSAPEALTLAVIGEIVLESGAVIDGADPEDYEIWVDGARVRGYTKDITFLNVGSDPGRDPFPAPHFDVAVPVGSTSLDVTVKVLADGDLEEGQEHMSFMVFRGEDLVNENTWDGTGVNIESGDAGVVKQLAVADAEATEGEDPSLDFVVTLAPAAAWTVTVDYATHDGTARAGSDYTDTSGALTFAPGDTEKTVSVPVIDDTVEDTPETLTLRLSNADPPYNDEEGEREWGSEEAGVLIADDEATGTIRNTEDAADLSADFPESAFASKRHTGSDDRPQVVVAFSEAVAEFAANTPSVSVTGASGLSVQPHAEDGLENAYIFFMTPDGDGDVTFALTRNAACAAGGICTAGGTMLAQAPAAWTIPGPGGGSSSLSVADAEATEEGDGTMAFVVTLDPAARDTVTVDYATSDGSAEAGDDYTATSGTLTFQAGETEKTISVPVTDDTEEDGGETFALTLSNASGADLGDAEATGTIRDNDTTATPLTASFENLPATHDGSSEFTFQVEFSEDVGISYVTLRDDGFTVTKGDVTGARRVDGRHDLWEVTVEPDGREAVTITLPGDRACHETGAVCTRGENPRPLSNSPSATVAGPTVAVTPTVGISDAGGTEGDGDIAFTVTLDSAGTDTVTVDYATSNGSATASDDYTATSGTLTFDAGTTSGTISVPIADDDVNEGDETFTVTLSNASGADLGTSIATGTIQNRNATPLTASFGNVPAEHDGTTFVFHVQFSEDPAVSYRVLRYESFDVTGGKVVGARRKDGRDDLREIHVEPSGDGDVTVSLPPTTDCDADGAICTADDRPLSNATAATVRAMAVLSVADAETTEGVGAMLDFAVTLSRAASGTVTVGYATSDGTAVAGTDYTSASGTLTFDPGETAGTVSVTVLDDSVDDDGETLTLTLSNPSGARLADATATGTINNADPVPRAWLVRFGRTAADHAVEAIGARFEDSAGGSHATFAGRRLLGRHPRPEPLDAHGGPFGTDAGLEARFGQGLGGHGSPFGADGQPGMFGAQPGLPMSAGMGASGTGGHRPALRDLLIGSSFLLSAAGADAVGDRRLTAWGRASATRFNGADDEVRLDGDVATFLLGADAAWDRWLAGISVAHSLGAGGFSGGADGETGEMDSALTAVHPYLRYQATDRISAWGVLGYGAGDLTLKTDGSAWETDTSMRMAAAGVRGVLLSTDAGLQLTARTDVRFTHIGSGEAVGDAGLLGETAGGTSRVRLLLEGSRPFAFGATRTLTPTLELGVRRDGGDAETGMGVDLSGSLRYADAALGLTAEAAGRYLAAHEDAGYREWGASATIRIDPGVSGRGLTLSVAPSWGADAAGGAQRLWSARDARGLAGHGFDTAMRLRAEVGYGLSAFRDRGAAMPFAGVSTTVSGRDWRAGARWTRGQALEMALEAVRRESAGAAPEHGIEFRLAWRLGARGPARGAADRLAEAAGDDTAPGRPKAR